MMTKLFEESPVLGSGASSYYWKSDSIFLHLMQRFCIFHGQYLVFND